MRMRRLTVSTSLAVAAAFVGVTVTLTAQSAPRTMARTPDGQPDLQGTYDIATITPMERPAQFGARMNMTREEALALEKGELTRDQKLNQNDTADRAAPPVGGAKANPNATYLERLFEGGGGAVGGYNNFWLAPGSHVVVVNGEARSSIVVDPPDGRGARRKRGGARGNRGD